MLGFFDWVIIHNNWVFLVFSFALWGLLGMSYSEGWKKRLSWFLVGGVIGAVIVGGVGTYEGYRTYKNHYTTCAKPEAVNAFYVFDFQRERCLKPFVGLVPVNATGNVELKDAPKQPKQVTKPTYQLVNVPKGADNV